MSGRWGRIAVAAVLFILGFLVIVQLRSQAGGTGLDALTNQDLSALIANLNARNGQLVTEVGTLEAQLRDMEAARLRGETSADGLRADLRRLRLWAGLDPVRGQGVTVDISGTIGADAIGDLLNELRSAGAEALAIDGRRVVAATVVSGEPGALVLDGKPVSPAFQVAAIGNPMNLAAALTRVGGAVGRIEAANPDVTIVVAPADALVLPASDRDFAPVHARPRV